MAIQISLEKVGPKRAEEWLDKFNNTNRSMRSGVSEQYAKDMRNGRWTQCVDPIIFYEDGDLANGQHRLFAVIDSGTTQEFILVRGLDRASGLNLDMGLVRSLVDNGRISGEDMELSTGLIATARAVEKGNPGGDRMSNAEKIEIVQAHREPSQWALKAMPRVKNITNAAVLGAVARAWYYEDDLERLGRYCEVLGTGFGDGDRDSAAIAMRNYLLQNAGKAATSAQWRDTFLKAMNSIKYFMAERKLTVIKGVKDEAYPLKKKYAVKQPTQKQAA